MMRGYLNRPEATQAMLWRDADGDLYFRSGDIGRLDADGFLHLLDRKKDVIISGGLNVYATDIEAVLLQHPNVAEAAVIAVPSERWGESPWAFIVLEREGTTPGELVEWCNARVGKSQRLAGVSLAAELPKNAIGKVLKRALKLLKRVPEVSGP
jgi:acyl-CoA synthetase (AMP-forming)/AMP-acid ligase II